MSEPSLRMRVKEIQENDPALFEELQELKDSFPQKIKEKQWLDRRIVIKERDVMTGAIRKRTWTIEDAIRFIWDTWEEEMAYV